MHTTKPSSFEEFQPDALTRKVLNLDVTFHWIPGAERFWFMRQTRTGEDEFVIVDAQTGEQALAPAGSVPFQEPQVTSGVVSPNGHQEILRRDDNLWVRDLSSGEERRLTHDGESYFGYGDVDPSYDRRGVARRGAHQPDPPRGSRPVLRQKGRRAAARPSARPPAGDSMVAQQSLCRCAAAGFALHPGTVVHDGVRNTG